MKISAQMIEITVFLLFTFVLGIYLGKMLNFQEKNEVPVCDICDVNSVEIHK